MTATPTLNLKRFLPTAIAGAALAAVLWHYTKSLNADITIAGAKTFHNLAGRPAPYLLCDQTRYFWHATLFPPLIGLTLASTWLSWPARLIRCIIGYAAYASLTAVAITIHDSPYLQQNQFVKSTTSALVNANYLVFGLVIWILAAGPWYMNPHQESANTMSQTIFKRLYNAVTSHWLFRLTLLVLGVALIVPLFAMTANPEARQARNELATAMRKVPFFPHPSIDLSSTVGRVPPAEPHPATAEIATTSPWDITNSPYTRAQWNARDLAVRNALAAIEHAANIDAKANLPSPALYHLMGHTFWSMRPEDKTLQGRVLAAGQLALKKARQTKPH
jgi:hypothetical protein